MADTDADDDASRDASGDAGTDADDDATRDAEDATHDVAHRRILDRVWTQLPTQQNRTSSAWWFFILFPDGETGFGPRQLMFSIAARVGDRIRVNDEWLPGMDLDRDVSCGVDEFDVISVGWDGDADGVEERIVNQPARARLAADGTIEAWTETESGERRGSAIRDASHPDAVGEFAPSHVGRDGALGLEATFAGEKGTATFDAWSERDTATGVPIQSMDMDTPLGGVDVVAWRQPRFRGEFDLPASDDTEVLEGSCYFQRVCFNVPLFPWKWIWAVFPDGSAFSAMIPFLGPHVLRKGYEFYDSRRLERLTLPVRDSAFFAPADATDVIEFDDVSIEPVFGDGSIDHVIGDGSGDTDEGARADAGRDGSHPDFAVEATTDDGEFLSFTAATYGHARNHIDRPLLGGRLESHWSYNEFLVELEDLDGRVADRHLSTEILGDGYGTVEYSTGFGL